MKTTPAGIDLTIDGKRCTVAEGVTLLEAAQQQGIVIPTLCHHPALSAWGGCRLCVVEVDRAPRLVASCVTPVRRGMDVVTTNERILRYRRTMVEFLLAERNHNCMFCPQSGDCELQSLAYALGVDHLSVPGSFESFATDVTCADMAIDHNRCVLCGRCVRACREIAACQVLGFHHRGEKTMVGLDLNASRNDSDCLGCGVCVQVCPTGAMTSRYRTHYAVKGHDRDWQTLEDFCPLCGLMCPTVSRVRDNQLLRVDGRLGVRNGRPDRGQLCRRGRFEPLKDPGPRLTTPMVRDGAGRWVAVDWTRAVDAVAAGIEAVRQRQGAAALLGLASSLASNEALVMFKLLVTEAWQAGKMDTCDGDLCRAVTGVLGNNGQALWQESSWESLGVADMVLVIGADLDRENPLLASVLRWRQREAGIAMAVVGGQVMRGPIAFEHLGVPDSELAAQVRSLGVAAIKGGAAGPQALDRVARAYTAARRAADHRRGGPGRPLWSGHRGGRGGPGPPAMPRRGPTVAPGHPQEAGQQRRGLAPGNGRRRCDAGPGPMPGRHRAAGRYRNGAVAAYRRHAARRLSDRLDPLDACPDGHRSRRALADSVLARDRRQLLHPGRR